MKNPLTFLWPQPAQSTTPVDVVIDAPALPANPSEYQYVPKAMLQALHAEAKKKTKGQYNLLDLGMMTLGAGLVAFAAGYSFADAKPAEIVTVEKPVVVEKPITVEKPVPVDRNCLAFCSK